MVKSHAFLLNQFIALKINAIFFHRILDNEFTLLDKAINHYKGVQTFS